MATYSSQSTRSEPASLSDAGGGNQMSAWWWTEDRLQSVWSLFSKSQGDAVKDSAGVWASCMWMKCSLEDGLNSCVLLQLRATEHSRERGWRNETHVVPWAIAPSPGYASSSKNGWKFSVVITRMLCHITPMIWPTIKRTLFLPYACAAWGQLNNGQLKQTRGKTLGLLHIQTLKKLLKWHKCYQFGNEFC